MEFRVAAHPAEDALILQGGERSDQSEIYENGVLVGKWVKVWETAEEDLAKTSDLVTRQNEQGRLEVLVLVSPDDVNEGDLRGVVPSPDVMSGGLALALEFNDEGSAKLWNLSKKCIRREPQRRMATIMDGRVTAAPVVRSPLRRHAQITGDFTKGVIESIRQRSEKGLVVDIYDGPPPLIAVTPLRLAVFIVVLLIIVVGSLPAKELRKSKHPKVWTICGTIIGILVGAYILGVSRVEPKANAVEEFPGAIFAEVIQISILELLLGGVIGAVLGFLGGRVCRFFVRRATHKLASLVLRLASLFSLKAGRPEQADEQAGEDEQQ
jgi:hypothetical protein